MVTVGDMVNLTPLRFDPPLPSGLPLTHHMGTQGKSGSV